MSIRKPILFLAALVLIGGCQNSCSKDKDKETNIAEIPFGQLYDSSVTVINDHFQRISVPDLAKKVEVNKESFVLMVFNPDEGCTCWTDEFAPVLLKYMRKYSLQLFYVDIAELSNAADSYGIKMLGGEETIAIFQKGKLLDQKNTGGDKNVWATDYDVFESWMNERIKIGNFLYLTKNQLDAKLQGNEQFTLAYLRSGCGDCAYLYQSFLNEYSMQAKNVCYALDLDLQGIRTTETIASGDYQEFKDDYGLAQTEEHPTLFGYGGGFVPSFYRYEGNKTKFDNEQIYDQILDGCVYFNDTIVAEDDHYLVQSSYYSEERIPSLAFLDDSDLNAKVLQGLELPKEDVTVYEGGYTAWNPDKAAAYHDPLAMAFLDFYLG